MIQELVYTSSPKGLKLGSSGFLYRGKFFRYGSKHGRVFGVTERLSSSFRS